MTALLERFAPTATPNIISLLILTTLLFSQVGKPVLDNQVTHHPLIRGSMLHPIRLM